MEQTQENSRGRFQKLEVLDTEIKSSEEYTRMLKLRRNALLPVSSLPPEVFAAIFSMLCLPGTSSLDGKPDHQLAKRVSHVCHQWREIALNQPLLWAHVNFTTLSSARAAEILVRAKSAPLYLEASFFGHGWDDLRFSTFREELQARIPHMRELTASAGPIHLHETLKEIVSPAPTLEYLSLSSRDVFNGSTPRLACLKLSYCDVSWKLPLLKALKNLEIRTPSMTARPELAVWLDALNEMSQLVTLTLHFASPIAPSVPFHVERTVTLPSLTRLDILANPGDCALALAHLDLPALTSLFLTTISSRLPNNSDLRQLLPHVAQHAHGPQDTQPLQSMLICQSYRADILAWPDPDMDIKVHDPHTFLAMTRVALSFRSDDWPHPDQLLAILDKVMAGLPLGGLVTLATDDKHSGLDRGDLPTQNFWHHLSPKWPLLKHVRLAPFATRGFMEMVLEDNGGREQPLLPLLEDLTVVDFSLSRLSGYPLYHALKKRMEQGVPVGMLDLRMCAPNPSGRAKAWLQSLTEFVYVEGPEENSREREFMNYIWRTVADGPFVDDDNFGESDHSDGTDTSDDEDESSNDGWEMDDDGVMEDDAAGETEDYY